MSLGPATVEATWDRRAGTLTTAEHAVPVARTARGLDRAIEELLRRIHAARGRPRRVAVRDPGGTLRHVHHLPPGEPPAMAERVEPAKSNVTPELTQEHYRSIRDAERKKDEAVALVRTARKRAKAAGVILADYDAAVRLKRMDSDERETHLLNMARYCAWLGCELGTQADMFGEPEKPTEKSAARHAEYEAEERGYTDGTHGVPADNGPYQLGTPIAAAWARGWSKGDAFRQGLAQPDEVKPRRGAKRGAGNPEDAVH